MKNIAWAASFTSKILFILCLILPLELISQPITWNPLSTSDTYISTQKVCRANEGYIEYNPTTGIEHYVGLTTKFNPANLSEVEYAFKLSNTTVLNTYKVDFYLHGNLHATAYITTSSMNNARINRFGSLLEFRINGNLQLSYNIDANLYYRFYVLTPVGASPTALNAKASTGFCTPCTSTTPVSATDVAYNWSGGKTYDGAQQEVHQVGESRTYYNYLGETIQTQDKDFSDNTVLGMEHLYDAQGRKVIEILPAPTGNTNIKYAPNFVQDQNGGAYDYRDFDKSNGVDNTNTPIALGTQAKTVGAYYSNANTDKYIPESSYPYSRMVYALDGTVKKISGVGETFKMGSGKEVESYTVNSGAELNYIYGGRNSYEVDVPSENPLEPLPRELNQYINAVKTVTVTSDKIEAISFETVSGLPLASCVSGVPETTDCPHQIARHRVYNNVRASSLNEFGTNSVRIHLPKSTKNTLKFYYGNDIAYYVSQNPNTYLEFSIYDLKEDRLLVKDVDYTLSLETSNYRYSVNFTAPPPPNTVQSGYYRIYYKYTPAYYAKYDKFYIRGAEPPVDIIYELDYSNWTINYYDTKGNLRKSVSPKGINCSLGNPSDYQLTKVYQNKDFYTVNGTTHTYGNFSNYLIKDIAIPNNSNPNLGRELNLRVRSMFKGGLVGDLYKKDFNNNTVFSSNAIDIQRVEQPSPSAPNGGGTYLDIDESTYYDLFYTPSASQMEDGIYNYPAPQPKPGVPNPEDVPATCFNGIKDLNEVWIDWGGVCGYTSEDPCTDPPTHLVSFRIKIQVKQDATVLHTVDLFRSLGSTCYGKVVEIQSTPDNTSEFQKIFKGLVQGVPVSVSVIEVKVKNTLTGTYSENFIASNVTHRFLRYIMLKLEADQETYLLNPVPHTLATTHHYDNLNRLVATIDPDRGKTEYLYDAEGKLKFFQDAEMRARSTGDTSTFGYIFYDRLGRLVETGRYRKIGASVIRFPEAYYESDAVPPQGIDLSAPSVINPYDESVPPLINRTERVITVYDKPASNFPAGSSYVKYKTMFAEGAVSSTSNDEMVSWHRYNHLGQLTGTVKKFKNLGANDIGHKTFDYEYDFFGRLKKSTYQIDIQNERFANIYTYNANGDLVFSETAYKDEPVKRHAKYIYNKTRQLRRVELGVKTQGLDYVYTIDGRLKSFNHPDMSTLNNDPGKDGNSAGFAKDVFAFTLDYSPADYVRTGSKITYGISNGSDEKYDGRIKSMRWNTGHNLARAPNSNEHMFKYTYNWEQQLAELRYGLYVANSTTNNSSGGGNFNNPTYGTFTPNADNALHEKMLDPSNPTDINSGYDLNGNIKFLSRRDKDGVLIDDLTYNYSSGKNQLSHVTDASNYSNTSVNHVISQLTGNYVYNANGDIVRDAERSILVNYNFYGNISLVRDRVTGHKLIEFFYDDQGNRVRKVSYKTVGSGANIPEKSTLYLREPSGGLFCIFEDHPETGVFAQEEIMLDGGKTGVFYLPKPSARQATYIYGIKDHLGNNRVNILRDKISPFIVGYANYGAWGMTMQELTSPTFTSRAGFQGQEYEKKIGMYGFGLRMYDQRLGRWFSTDPKGQHWSPYLAMSNNPVSFVDPDGGWDGWHERKHIDYFVDGIRVDGITFQGFIRSAAHGDEIDFGQLAFGDFENTFLTIKPIKYNQYEQGWAFGFDVHYGGTYKYGGMSNVKDPNGVIEGKASGDVIKSYRFIRLDVDQFFNKEKLPDDWYKNKFTGEYKWFAGSEERLGYIRMPSNFKFSHVSTNGFLDYAETATELSSLSMEGYSKYKFNLIIAQRRLNIGLGLVNNSINSPILSLRSSYTSLLRFRLFSTPLSTVSGGLTGINTINDYVSYQDGEISKSRFTYKLTGAMVGLTVSRIFGGIPGAVVGTGFLIGEEVYDWTDWFFNDMFIPNSVRTFNILNYKPHR